ncbi:hypothetical protein [Aestuariivirga litoralis]|uniref:hypothetical protein n=1 Tax=Aestuariivirga litoralis TaxID=2650924 RepID=UPI0018C63B13|nr:hypothetical protein [Aestuariivirga litoralis]MBG1231828.1 hypothetical protein [Aestuariivirga litoralis]
MKSLTLASLAATLLMTVSAHAGPVDKKCPYIGNWTNAPLFACPDVQSVGSKHKEISSQPVPHDTPTPEVDRS